MSALLSLMSQQKQEDDDALQLKSSAESDRLITTQRGANDSGAFSESNEMSGKPSDQSTEISQDIRIIEEPRAFHPAIGPLPLLSIDISQTYPYAAVLNDSIANNKISQPPFTFSNRK